MRIFRSIFRSPGNRLQFRRLFIYFVDRLRLQRPGRRREFFNESDAISCTTRNFPRDVSSAICASSVTCRAVDFLANKRYVTVKLGKSAFLPTIHNYTTTSEAFSAWNIIALLDTVCDMFLSNEGALVAQINDLHFWENDV